MKKISSKVNVKILVWSTEEGSIAEAHYEVDGLPRTARTVPFRDERDMIDTLSAVVRQSVGHNNVECTDIERFNEAPEIRDKKLDE